MFSPSMTSGSLDTAVLMAQDILRKKASHQQNHKKKKGTIGSSSSSAMRRKKSSSSSQKQSSHGSKKVTTRTTKISTLDADSGSISCSQPVDISLLSEASGQLLRKSSTHTCASTDSGGPEDSTSSTAGGIKKRDNMYFQHSIVVDKVWQTVKGSMPDYETKVGEQILLRMMEKDPSTRQAMHITSLRSARFDEIAKMLVVVVDLMASVFGPDLDEYVDDLEHLGQECADKGIRVALLCDAVPFALQMALAREHIPFTAEDQDTWALVVSRVAQEMEVAMAE